jgi:sterol desaturase/sphingolipid hydroxylase (fatty acid hydroxylase superfamily)
MDRSKFQRLIAIEKKRYQKKGVVNTAIGIFLLFGLMWVSVTVGKACWP